jgi:hypothetical protein
MHNVIKGGAMVAHSVYRLGYKLDNWDSFLVGVITGIFLFTDWPYWLWGPLSLLSSGYQGLFSQG